MFTCVVAIIALLANTHQMPGLIAPLLASPALLLATHRCRDPHKAGRLLLLHRFGSAYILLSLCVAVFYLPLHGLLFASVAVLVLLGLLNNQFYVFLAAKRSLPFMLAAIHFACSITSTMVFHLLSGCCATRGWRHLPDRACSIQTRPTLLRPGFRFYSRTSSADHQVSVN